MPSFLPFRANLSLANDPPTRPQGRFSDRVGTIVIVFSVFHEWLNRESPDKRATRVIGSGFQLNLRSSFAGTTPLIASDDMRFGDGRVAMELNRKSSWRWAHRGVAIPLWRPNPQHPTPGPNRQSFVDLAAGRINGCLSDRIHSLEWIVAVLRRRRSLLSLGDLSGELRGDGVRWYSRFLTRNPLTPTAASSSPSPGSW
jgi:hypothetical protein